MGMDMSMLGSFEYSALYTFRSMFHFWLYFYRAKHSFNARYVVNRPYYFRPRSEFEDARIIFSYDKIKFFRVYETFKYCAPFDAIESISFKQLLDKG